jgi:hypothetical protein
VGNVDLSLAGMSMLSMIFILSLETYHPIRQIREKFVSEVILEGKPSSNQTWGERPNGKVFLKSKGWVSRKEFRDHLNKRPNCAVHSDGVLYLSGLTDPSYECPSCGFRGFFQSAICHKCGHNV